MNKIPRIKFIKSSTALKQISKSAEAIGRPKRVIRDEAIRETQPIIQTEQYRGPIRKHNEKAIKIVNHFAKKASADIRQGTPLFYHPDFEPSSLILPKDRIEINSWCNYFYKYDALVSTAVDMHSELPLSKIRLDVPKTPNKKLGNRILEHYVDMIGNTGIDLFNKLLMFGVEYHKLGNVFPWAQANYDKTKWVKLTCLNPDYVHVEKLALTNAINISLVPDDRLRHIVHAGPYDQKTGKLYQTLSEEALEYVIAGKEIPLSTDPNDGSHVTHLARKIADYVDWGTSIIERNFKTLVYKDRLRQSQDAIATRHLTPKHLIWADLASRADVGEIREQVEDAMMNPDQAIITNYELHWELIGTSSGLMQLATEREWITEDLLIGLMINKNILLGEGNFAAGQSVLEVLNQRYAIFRELLECYIEKNLFLPIAKNNGFVDYAPGTVKKEKRLVYLYPKVRWNRLNLTDDTQHKQMLGQAVSEGKCDVGTWLEYFGLNSDSIAERLKANEDTVLDPTYNELRRSIMNEVGRSLGPAVAKVYADAYGLELQDQGGGMGMFGSSKVPITKFGKEFDINYNDDGSMSVKPQMVVENYEIKNKTAETRDERRHNRELNKSNTNIETVKDNLEEIKTIDSDKLKPPRDDLRKKKVPRIFKTTNNLNNIFHAANLSKDQDNSITFDEKPISEISVEYDDMSMLQSPDKVDEVVNKNQKVENEKKEFSQILEKQGVDQHTRQLVRSSEEEIVNNYYKLAKQVVNNDLNDTINKRIHQIYTGLYHSIINPNETMFKSAQTIKELLLHDVRSNSSKLIQKIEILSTANRKIAQKNDNVAVRSQEVFKLNENSIRKAFRSTVTEIAKDLRGLLS
jgi:hypothetical protein